MSRSFLTVSCLSLLSLAACGRSGGTHVDASLSGMFPASVFDGRSYEIGVSGVESGWSASAPPAVDLGAGVTVTGVHVASETALVVDVDVADDAPPGSRDVTVGGLTYAGFEVRASMSLEIVEGRFEQGTELFGILRCLDPETPFATGASVAVEASNGAIGVCQGPSPDEMDFQILLDPTVGSGSFDLLVEGSASPLLRDRFVIHDAASLLARAADTTFPEHVVLTYPESGLHRYDAGALPALVRFPMMMFGGVVPNLYRSDAWFPSGFESHPNDSIQGPVTITLPGDVEFVYAQMPVGASGDYTITPPIVEAVPAVDEVEPNTFPATAQIVTLPTIVKNADFTDSTDGHGDTYAFVAGAADVGKKLRVVTSGNAFSSPVVEVFRSDLVTKIGTSVNFGSHADFTTAPIPAAETLYVRIVPALGGLIDSFASASGYRVLLRLE